MFKVSRSGAPGQYEEELSRKVAAAGSDYESKVYTANSLRRELAASQHPQTVQALKEMVHECDSALTVQIQKYGVLSKH